MRSLTNVLVTGGAGFIGSNFIRFLLGRPEFSGRIVNVDTLTYAGNLENLRDVEASFADKRYFFEKADICDFDRMKQIYAAYDVDTVVHFAAETHVDRSIYGPKDFIQTNIMGTFSLLEAARGKWENRNDVIFHHVSTDEVFGSLGESGFFSETTPYDPKSPYSASKASSDHIVRALHHTYGLPVTISNCSNNYGPYQFPEKLIPLAILNLLDGKPVPVYGDGKNVRDWLFVDDHARAIWTILRKGESGRTYTVGGGNEWENLRLVNQLCEKVAVQMGKPKDSLTRLITLVKDRPGHDRRYAIDCSRIMSELGWRNETDFPTGLDLTIRWYRDHPDWVRRVRTGDYRSWMEKNYGATT
jgi:dTDP-glucose 4,6-dehydratase